MRHQSGALNIATIVTSLLFIGIALFWPDIAHTLAPWVVILSVFIVGIPHGAIDHVIAAELFGLNQKLTDHLLFYGSYLLIMIFVGALWIFFPIGGMIFFLAISIYHFGQADMEDFITKKRKGNWLFHLARGTLIIGLIVFVRTDETFPIMAEAMRIESSTLAAILPPSFITVTSILLIYLAIVSFGGLTERISRFGSFMFDSVLLALVLILTGPLIGFAIYFSLWHSAGHINEMREFFESKKKSLSIPQFYWKATPFTLVSFLGLAMLLGINQVYGLEDQFLSLMFILISVLTLPHMVIVDKMYDEKRTQSIS